MKFGLALGGGGARGAAHIGILAKLEQLGLRPDLVTGTSIGGLVGALIAAGLNAAEITTVFREMRFGKLYSLPGRKPALTDHNRLEDLLEQAIGRPTFDELQLPLAVMATDLVTRELLALHEGDVISAVLATTAFPVILPPVQREGRTLIDGGVLNNTPFDVAREMGADYVLAVDLAKSAPYGTPIPYPPGSNIIERFLIRRQREPIYQAVSTMADILTWENVRVRVAEEPPDLLLRPAVGTVGLFDFHRLEAGIAAGREAADSAEEELQKLVARRQATA
ncbi:MAG: patatin-like phospholipase family protein [Candidatus Promineifilaceae bacterium]|nr:patatin-like phospholipase family protein [Candidatus Promineifilaceae bacterium]